MVKWSGCWAASLGAAGGVARCSTRACCRHLVAGDPGTEHCGLVAPRHRFVWLCDTSTLRRLFVWPCGTLGHINLALWHPGAHLASLRHPGTQPLDLVAPRHVLDWPCCTPARARLALRHPGAHLASLRHPGTQPLGLVAPGNMRVWACGTRAVLAWPGGTWGSLTFDRHPGASWSELGAVRGLGLPSAGLDPAGSWGNPAGSRGLSRACFRVGLWLAGYSAVAAHLGRGRERAVVVGVPL